MAKESTLKIISKKHLARLEKERIQNRIIVITSIVVLAIVVIVVGFGILNQTVFRNTKPVAKIGSEKISAVDFEKSVRFQRQQLVNQYNSYVSLSQSFGDNSNLTSYFQSSLDQITTQLNDPEALGSTVLDNMVNDRVIRQEAKKRKLSVTADEIEKLLQENFQYFADGTPTPVVNPTDAPTPPPSPAQLAMIKTLVPTIAPSATLEPTLDSQSPTTAPTFVPPTAEGGPTPTTEVQPTATLVSFESYKTQLADVITNFSNIKFTESDIRILFEFGLYKKKLYEDITKDIKPVEDQVWARHILVKTEEEALKVKARFENGETWETLALENSSDTSNSAQGGDLGWFGSGKMVKEFETAAFNTPVGQVSSPVQTQFGWHLIQIIGHEERPLSTVELKTLKDNAFQSWLDTALTTYKITKYDFWKEIVPTDPSI